MSELEPIAMMGDFPIKLWEDDQNIIWSHLRSNAEDFAINHGCLVSPDSGEQRAISFFRIEQGEDGPVIVPAVVEQAQFVKARLVMQAVRAGQ